MYLDSSETSAAPASFSLAERDAYLARIPTETTRGERALLFEHFSREWDGRGAVVEIGPFLGGTTRAIAWGMQHNPAAPSTACVHTFDRFDVYYSPDQLRRTVEPLVRNGDLPAAQADALCATADFEALFHAIHRPHAYASRIRLHNSPLPDFPEELAASRAFAPIAHESEFGAVFVDGCKSWTSTLYAMRELLPRCRPGAAVIFQDFGWFTCFWISSVVHALRDHLSLVRHVDATYHYKLVRPITAEEVSARFTPAPHAMGERFFFEAASALIQSSLARGDLRGELIAQLHLVAALATLGDQPAARKVLQGVNPGRYVADAALIRGSLASPTYLPGNRPIRWSHAA
ncbi:MAG: class I SAM-dependent methyltransferase [Opitutaceae bacterium]|jgi:predicted O-methyltransferase YrrM|nr:class I SAM-dependent methyltransferase [Opitutaceae bacterium]